MRRRVVNCRSSSGHKPVPWPALRLFPPGNLHPRTTDRDSYGPYPSGRHANSSRTRVTCRSSPSASSANDGRQSSPDPDHSAADPPERRARGLRPPARRHHTQRAIEMGRADDANRRAARHRLQRDGDRSGHVRRAWWTSRSCKAPCQRVRPVACSCRLPKHDWSAGRRVAASSGRPDRWRGPWLRAPVSSAARRCARPPRRPPTYRSPAAQTP